MSATAPTQDEPARRVIFVQGDAQARLIAQSLASFPPFAARFDLRPVPAEAVLAMQIAALGPAEAVGLAGAFVQIRDPLIVQEGVPARMPVLRFPRLSVGCLWPLRPAAGAPTSDSWRAPPVDRVAATLAAEKPPEPRGQEAQFGAYLARSSVAMPDPAALLEADIAAWRALDRACDIKVADFLATRLTAECLFHAPDAAAGPALAFIAEQMLAGLARVFPLPPSELLAWFGRHLCNWQGEAAWQVPVHPLVAEKLGLAWYDPARRYRWNRHEWDFRAWVLDAARPAPSCPAQSCMAPELVAPEAVAP